MEEFEGYPAAGKNYFQQQNLMAANSSNFNNDVFAQYQIETDHTPHTAYYRPQLGNLRQQHYFENDEPSIMQPEEKLRLQQSLRKAGVMQPEQLYEETMLLAKAHLEDTAATMQRLRESQASQYPKTSQVDVRKSLEVAREAENRLRESGQWTPGYTQPVILQQQQYQMDALNYGRFSDATPQMPIFPSAASNGTGKPFPVKSMHTQRTSLPSTASHSLYYRTPANLGSKKPFQPSPHVLAQLHNNNSSFNMDTSSPQTVKTKLSSSRQPSPLTKYKQTVQHHPSHSNHHYPPLTNGGTGGGGSLERIQEATQSPRQMIQISYQGMQFQRRQLSGYSNLNHAKNQLALPVRQRRGQYQGLYEPTHLFQQKLSSGQKTSYGQSLRQHLQMQGPTDFSSSRSITHNSKMISSGDSSKNKKFSNQMSSNPQTRFMSNTNMKFFSHQRSGQLQIGDGKEMKKNPSWQQLQSQQKLLLTTVNNHSTSSKHSRGTLETAQALNNLLALQQQNVGKITAVSKNRLKMLTSKASQKSIGNHAIRARNSIEFKTSPVSKLSVVAVLKGESKFSNQRRKLTSFNMIPAPQTHATIVYDNNSKKSFKKQSVDRIMANDHASIQLLNNDSKLSQQQQQQQQRRRVIKNIGTVNQKKIKALNQKLQTNRLAYPTVDRINKLQKAYLNITSQIVVDTSFETKMKQHSVERGAGAANGRDRQKSRVKSKESLRRAKEVYKSHERNKQNELNLGGTRGKSYDLPIEGEEGSLDRILNGGSSQGGCHCSVHDGFEDSLTRKDLSFDHMRPKNRHSLGSCHHSDGRNSARSLGSKQSNSFKKTSHKRRLYEDEATCNRCHKKRNELSESQAFEQGNMFKEAARHLTRKRSASGDILMRKGLNYRFSLKDLSKYSQRLNVRDIQKLDRLSRSAMGARSKIPTLTDRVRKLDKQRGGKMMLQQGGDWAKSNLYQQFLKHGRTLTKSALGEAAPQGGKGAISVDSVYTETELRYYIEFLRKMTMQKYHDVKDKEQQKMLDSHNLKSQVTLKWLMRLIGFDYYYERILFRYQKQPKSQLNNTIKVMVRSLQMYETIDQLLLAFSLLQKIDKAQTSEDAQLERHLSIRLLAVLKQLMNHSKFLQRRFAFKGVPDLVQSVERRLQELNALVKSSAQGVQ